MESLKADEVFHIELWFLCYLKILNIHYQSTGAENLKLKGVKLVCHSKWDLIHRIFSGTFLINAQEITNIGNTKRSYLFLAEEY